MFCIYSFVDSVSRVPVGNGDCASTCAMFSTLMYEHYNTKIASIGGGTGHLEYKGMAGNQVLEWADLASEIKTADLENVREFDYVGEGERCTDDVQDPLAPPDLLISGNMR